MQSIKSQLPPRLPRSSGGVYMGATETPLSKDEVLAAAQPFLAGAGSVSGGAAVTK